MVREVGAQGPGAVITLRSRELAAAADANRLIHTSWVPRQLPGMTVRSRPELTVVDSGLACDTFNVVGAARLDPAEARVHAQEVVEYFARVERPFSWWVGPTDQPADLDRYLRDVGLEPAETALAMAAPLDGLGDGDPLPEGFRIERVADAERLLDFARINAANWSPPDQQVLRFYQLAAPILLQPDSCQLLYVGYLGGTAVATAELTVGEGVVGLYNIATLAASRRRGFGTAMARRPLIDARRRGFETAILQAAPDAVGIYRRLGFEAYGQIAEFKPR